MIETVWFHLLSFHNLFLFPLIQLLMSMVCVHLRPWLSNGLELAGEGGCCPQAGSGVVAPGVVGKKSERGEMKVAEDEDKSQKVKPENFCRHSCRTWSL
jgi:hypothetical protein